MNLAFITPYPPSQVTLNEYGYHLTRSFLGKKEIEKIYILTNNLEDNSEYSRYATEGLEIIPCWDFDSVFTVLNLRKKLKELQPDAVILNLQFMTFGAGKIPAALGLLTPWMCKLLGIPSVTILHNITETVNLETIGMANSKLKGKLFLWIGEQLTKFILKSDLVGVTISQYVTILKDKYKADNVILLPHGNFELPERNYVPEDSEEINLMAFGKFGTYKKAEVMIDAMEILQEKYPHLKFTSTVAGTDNPNVKGYIDGLKSKYAHLPNVEYTGYIPEEKVSQIFWDSTFVIFPYTTTTGSSGILHQAGSYGRACILPKIDDLERVVEEEGYGGAYFETDNAESLANAVSHLIENPEERKRIEDQNYKAAKGLPMGELSQWYLSHIHQLIRK
ncbi:glycosyltransferase involved in cell wall biosynthesis [Algoriphagus iocasae]|uniref:Glycosyltransferase involved in cell wall biosynthesis n=1 Tax=Algoriphagus iocasae TaxID=1836499 RepID=A0A841MDB2_9BACT|nr:glycosyltransferase [Algoriphagus iocasae]MBB6324723.1 glycosyltransferase involved in cell wall biosynthesis [Algoriphagus iocasae]